jgi:hypothetical protein
MASPISDLEQAKAFLRREVEKRDRSGIVENDILWVSGAHHQGHMYILVVWGRNAVPQLKGYVVMNNSQRTIYVLDASGGEIARHQYP